jgi:hypothetical protein
MRFPLSSTSPLSRRTLLRGAGGVAIALPFLDAMAPRRARAAGKAPKRLLTVITENGVVPSAWFPTGTERDFKLGSILQPMVPFQKNLLMIDGLENKTSGGTCHAVGRCGSLSGQNNNGGRAAGITIDQAVANGISAGTRLKSIEASVYLKHNFIYGLFFSGPGAMVTPEDEPALLFARLFSNGVPAAPGTATPMGADFMAMRMRRKSILDRTMEQYQKVSSTVGASDKMRLGRHMDGIREIERGLDALTGEGGMTMAGAACKLPDMPVGVDFPTHMKLQTDLVTMALACDITRVGSIQTRASLTAFTWLGINTAQHPLSHGQGSPGIDAQLNKIATWFAEQVAYLTTRLQSMPDSDGQTLFDNTLLFWSNDLAIGPHGKKRLPYLLASGKFTLPDGKLLDTGRYLNFPGRAHNDLLASVGQIMGIDCSKGFGAAGMTKGPLPLS